MFVRVTGPKVYIPAWIGSVSLLLPFCGMKLDFAKQFATRACLGLAAIAMLQATTASPAWAAKKAAAVPETLHTGQKIAKFFQSFGIPDLGVLTLISALPVVELRGAVPVGYVNISAEPVVTLAFADVIWYPCITHFFRL